MSQVPGQSVRLSKSEQTSAGKLRGLYLPGTSEPISDQHLWWFILLERRASLCVEEARCHSMPRSPPFIYGVFQASQADRLLRTVYNSSCLELTWPNLRSFMPAPGWSEVQPPGTVDVSSLWETCTPRSPWGHSHCTNMGPITEDWGLGLLLWDKTFLPLRVRKRAPMGCFQLAAPP